MREPLRALEVSAVAPAATPQAVARAMADTAKRYASSPADVVFARWALSPWRSLSTVAALGELARSVPFVREPLDIGEIIVAPPRLLELGRGDCDDVATLIAACAAALGLPSAVAVIATRPGHAHAAALVGDDPYQPGRLTHTIDQERGATPGAPPAMLAFAGVR